MGKTFYQCCSAKCVILSTTTLSDATNIMINREIISRSLGTATRTEMLNINKTAKLSTIPIMTPNNSVSSDNNCIDLLRLTDNQFLND